MTLKKEKVKRNKFNITFFYIVKFNNSSIVIFVTRFFKDEIPVTLRDNNGLLL